MAQLLAALRNYFVQLEAVRHINIASLNINTDTLPTTDVDKRLGDVWVDGNVLKVAGLTGGGGSYQPLDADLTAIAALTGAAGFLKTNGAGTWSVDTATYSLSSHTHTFASLTSIPTTIGGYGITDFNSLGDARWSLLGHNHSGTYAPASHTHAISDVTGLQTALDGKASVNISKIQALGSVSGSVSVNLTLGQIATATCTGACTWSFTNLTSGEVNNITLVLINPGAGTQTFPSGTVFDRNVAPTLPAAGTTALMFETYDNGTNWAAAQVWRNVA
jgi:hypothetical protein